MNINRNNYQEFLLLYVDNELSATERLAVDNFLLANPDLKIELELLQETTLEDIDVSFEEKDSLIQFSNQERESLLNYIDDELPTIEKSTIESLVQTNKAYATELAILSKTKLNGEVYVYEQKEQLLKRSGSVVSFIRFRNIAAAIVILLLAWPIYKLMTGNGPENNGTNVITASSEKKNSHSIQIPSISAVQENTAKNDITNHNEGPIQPSAINTIEPNKTLAASNSTNNSTTINTVASNNNASTPIDPKKDEIKSKPEENIDYENINILAGNKIETSNVQQSEQRQITTNNAPKVFAAALKEDTEENDNSILAFKEDDVKNSKLGSLFKKVKKAIRRPAIKINNTLKIGNVEVAIN